MKKKGLEDIDNSEQPPKKKSIGSKIKDRIKSYNNIPKFFKLIWQTSPGLTFIDIFVRLLQAIVPLVVLNVGKMIIDQIVLLKSRPGLSHYQIWKLVVIEFTLVICISIFSRVIMLIDDLIGELLTRRSNILLMSHAAKLDLVQFEDSAFYDKLERARQQTVGRTMLLSQVFGQAQDFITMISYIIILIAFNPWIIVILLVSIIPVFAGSTYFNAKNYSLIRSQTQGRRELDYLILIGSSDNTAKELRLLNLSGFFIDRYKKIAVSFYKAKSKLGINQTIVGTFLSVPGAVGFYMSFVYIINQVITGALSLGGLTFFLAAIRQLGSIAQNSGRRLKSVAEGAIYLQDYFDFFEIKPVIRSVSNPRPFPNPIIEGFKFEDVGFKYNNSNRWANRYLSFTVKPGEKLALVGENGAGKTTIVKLLTRLYEPTEGRITLDGYDLKAYDVNELRQQMGVIFQDFIRYQLTAAENIGVGDIKEINNMPQIVISAKQSFVHAIIDKLPNKYQQTLGHYFSGGFELSGGEWQKLALARAYMRNAAIIILDEPTAALDARAEYEMFQRFADVTQNKTALFISHRFSTVRMADRIMVLDKGGIIEMGSHDELLLKEGRYAELFQLQASGYK